MAAAHLVLPPRRPTTPGTAQIRVYSAFSMADGSVLDEGVVWASVGGVRATNVEEGLLGIALAPDFAISKLMYVYLTTTGLTPLAGIQAMIDGWEQVEAHASPVSAVLEALPNDHPDTHGDAQPRPQSAPGPEGAA